MQNSSVEDTYFGSKLSIRIGGELMDFAVPKVMGIVNVTPDSFYDGSRAMNEAIVLERVNDLLNSGADIIDVGGYSSRPGAEDISEEQELNRVIPMIRSIKKEFPKAILSIDTFRSSVAREAIENGANIINDISGFEIDPEIASVAGEYKVPYILMHMRGAPQSMQSDTHYDNLYREVALYFSQKIAVLREKGVTDIVLDPGFGFGKSIEQNHSLLRHFEAFHSFGCPLLAGVSRKSMIYKKLGIQPEDALNGTIALNAIALSKGAHILRVHDAKEASDLIHLLK